MNMKHIYDLCIRVGGEREREREKYSMSASPSLHLPDLTFSLGFGINDCG